MSNELEIKWVGSPNYGLPRGTTGRREYQVLAIVNHIMEGSLQGTDAWFSSRESGASAHFGVGKKGEIHQYVSLDNVAWHAGKVNNPSWSLLIPGLNPNYYTIGIEHEGFSGETMPEPQFQATLALHKMLIEKFHLEISEETIIGHYRIDSINKGKCPGDGFPWARLLKELQEQFPLYKDVPEDHWAYEAVKDVTEAGFMSGYPDDTFQGAKGVSRYELASVVARLLAKIKEKM